MTRKGRRTDDPQGAEGRRVTTVFATTSGTGPV